MSVTSSLDTVANSPTTATRTRLARGALVDKTLGAAVLGLALTAVTRLVAIALEPDLATVEQFGWVPVTGSVLAAVLGAAVVYAVLTRTAATPVRAFLAVGAFVLALSVVPIALGAGTFGFDTTAQLGLAAMHVACAVGIVGGFVALD